MASYAVYGAGLVKPSLVASAADTSLCASQHGRSPCSRQYSIIAAAQAEARPRRRKSGCVWISNSRLRLLMANEEQPET